MPKINTCSFFQTLQTLLDEGFGKQSAQKIIDALKKARVKLGKDDAMKIMMEVEKNPEVLKKAFSTLKDAYDQIPK